jgi:hypothetical protein
MTTLEPKFIKPDRYYLRDFLESTSPQTVNDHMLLE